MAGASECHVYQKGVGAVAAKDTKVEVSSTRNRPYQTMCFGSPHPCRLMAGRDHRALTICSRRNRMSVLLHSAVGETNGGRDVMCKRHPETDLTRSGIGYAA